MTLLRILIIVGLLYGAQISEEMGPFTAGLVGFMYVVVETAYSRQRRVFAELRRRFL